MLILTGIALTVGGAASMAAITLVDLVALLNTVLLVEPKARVQWESVPGFVALMTILVPTLGGLIVGLIHRHLSPAGRPLGPPDVIEAVQFHKPLPDLRSGLVSTFSAALSLGTGASVGQYGPMVYLGAIFGALLVYVIWIMSEPLALYVMELIAHFGQASFGWELPSNLESRALQARVFVIGLLITVVLRVAPKGLLPEKVKHHD